MILMAMGLLVLYITVIDQYLSKHEHQKILSYIFCGPPMMNQSVLKMGWMTWGIPDENVRLMILEVRYIFKSKTLTLE